MDATTNIKSRLPSRQMAEGPEHASRGALRSAMSLAMLQSERPVIGRVVRANADRSYEIFKKTPYGTGLQRVSQYVASDILEVASIPMLNKSLLNRGQLQGHRLTAGGRGVAESMKTVKWNSRQDVMRSADRLIAGNGDLVGSKRNPALATSESADAGTIGRDTGMGYLNIKLTDKELAVHPSKGKHRATNHASGTLWKYARQVGSAVDAVTQPDRAHEKYCHAYS